MLAKTFAIATLLAAAIVPAAAADFEVRLRHDTVTGAMVFQPTVTNVAVGDTVTFVPTQKGHSVEAIKDLLPAGAATFKGAVGEQLSVTFTAPGTYGVKCAPYAGAGMVGLVIVGTEPVDTGSIAAARLPQRAVQRLHAALEHGVH